MYILSRIYSNDLERVESGQLVYLYQEGEHELFKVVKKSTDYNNLPPMLESVKTGTRRALESTSGEMFFIMKNVE